MSAMTASEVRKQTVDFVEYVNAGSGIIVAAGVLIGAAVVAGAQWLPIWPRPMLFATIKSEVIGDSQAPY